LREIFYRQLVEELCKLPRKFSWRIEHSEEGCKIHIEYELSFKSWWFEKGNHSLSTIAIAVEHCVGELQDEDI